MNALAESLAQERASLSERHQLMADVVLDELARFSDGLLPYAEEDLPGWKAFTVAFEEALLDGQDLGPLVESAYRHVVVRRDERAQRNLPPRTEAGWGRVVRFDSADEIRRRAAG